MEQTLIDFRTLPFYQERRFIPKDVDLQSPQCVQEICHALLTQDIHSPEDLEKWILARSELEAALDQEAAVLYIRMTCYTDHEDFAKAYKNFIENVAPVVKQAQHDLNVKALQQWALFPFPEQGYSVYQRAVQADVEIFRKENIALSTQVELLSQEYQSICGAMTVHFDGEEMTLPQMNRYLYEPDRQLRERAWKAVAQRRLQEKDRFNDVFQTMLKLRHQKARNAGFKKFTEYQFKAYHRFDYAPQQCKDYHCMVQKIVVPVWEKILLRRKSRMSLDSLRPWDTEVDPYHRPALKPFTEVSQLLEGVARIMGRIHDDFSRAFRMMIEQGLLDLSSRKGKAPGGYQQTLAESRKPFIFMNAVGLDGDVWTLLHEAGHSFHALACAHHELYPYRHAPMEFCEVASMSMELLGGTYLSEFYKDADQQRAHQKHLESIVYVLLWVATVDAFQHWIYEHPDHSPQERSQAWLETHNRFGGYLLDWQGLEPLREILWQRQLHIFEVPFYYIEYAIAQIGALQIWLNFRKDPARTLQAFQSALALGGSKPLPELFRAAGLNFDFTSVTLTPLMEEIERELDL